MNYQAWSIGGQVREAVHRWRGDDAILRPGRNVWRLARAHRAAPLVDAAAYFAAVRATMAAAQRTILIAGWDIDSRVRLVGPSGEAEDGLPAPLGAFLTALVERRPGLSIRILLWDYSLVYAAEREPLPNLALGWGTPPQVEFCLDDVLPVAASHHQKIVVVDDAVAFAGGLDLTNRRWDTPAHDPGNRLRVDVANEPYPPFHDVQIMVDGAAARGLGDLVRRRWSRAACQALRATPPPEGGDPWPEHVTPMLRNVDIGIARTMPACYGAPAIREVEQLFIDMIDSAEQSIYIENQFLTALPIAERLIARLRERPALEVVIVAPQTHHTWLEHVTMLAGRIRFRDRIVEAGLGDRVRLLHPEVTDDKGAIAVMVHSKVMIVDDRLLRVGSANLCNRSMGVDTECDLAIEAQDDTARAAIARFRDGLLAEHCGSNANAVGEAFSRTGSLFGTLDTINGGARRLRPIEDGELRHAETVVPMDGLADPARPVSANEYLSAFDKGPSQVGRTSILFKSAIAVLVVIAVVLAWRHTPLAALADPEKLTSWMSSVTGNPWAPLGMILVFVVAGLIAFPVTVLIAGTAAAFGVWPGLPIAAAGTLLSAYCGYLIGRAIGAEPLKRLLGRRINRVRRNIVARGVLAVAAVRLAPIAPFTVVNLAGGATRVPVLDYLLGTAIGLAPGLIAMSLLGERFFDVLRDPSGSAVAVTVGLLAAWIGLAFGLQALVARWRR